LLKTIDKLEIISEVAQDKRVNTIYRFYRLVIDREDIMTGLECLIQLKGGQYLVVVVGDIKS
jgi:hypothetical protein